LQPSSPKSPASLSASPKRPPTVASLAI
jgi:hypothetical protein